MSDQHAFASRQRWAKKGSHERMSRAVNGRKFTPLEPPPIPTAVEQLIADLATERIEVIAVNGARNNGGIRYPKHAVTITALGPKSKSVQEQVAFHVQAIGYVCLQCVFAHLESNNRTAVMAVIQPAEES